MIDTKPPTLAKERIENAGRSIIKKAHAKGNALLGVMGAAMKKKARRRWGISQCMSTTRRMMNRRRRSGRT